MSETQYIRTRTKSGKEEMIALPTGGVAPHNQAWSTITDTPTTLAGYGITDGGGGGMVYPGAGIALSSGAAWESSIPNNSANWNTAYTDRLKWDGGATGLTPATGRTSLGGTTVGQNIFTLSNPSAISFLRMNADNSVSALSAADFKTALSLQNVTNESKSTMFNNPTLTETVTISGAYGAGVLKSLILQNTSNAASGNEISISYYFKSAAWTNNLQAQFALITDGYSSAALVYRNHDLDEGAADDLIERWRVNPDGNFIIGGVSGSQKLTVHGEIGIRYGNNLVHYDVSEAHYWLQVPHSTNEYYWCYDGTMQMKLVSDGTLYCKGDVIAAYTP